MADLDISTKIDKRTKEYRQSTDTRSADGEEMVTIIIPKTKGEVRDVYVNAAFKPYLLKRGVPVTVPASVIDVLKTAIQVQYEEVIDPVTGRKSLVEQETMSYPFQYA
jgi:hypothetical protein